MLYFSKLKLVVIYFIIITISFFFITNFVNNNNNSFISKKINLGLDLQGGSYLLLEVDSTPIVKQNFQTKLILLRKYLKEQKIKYSDLKIKDAAITFKLQNKDNELFEEYFFNKDNQINSYFDQYKSFEMDFVLNNNIITISYSKFGLIEIKNSTLNTLFQF